MGLLSSTMALPYSKFSSDSVIKLMEAELATVFSLYKFVAAFRSSKVLQANKLAIHLM